MKGCVLFLVPLVAAVAALFYLTTDRAFESLWFPKLAEVAGVRATAREAEWEPLSGFVARGVTFASDGGLSGEIDEIQASWNPAELFRAAVACNSLAATGGRIEWRPPAAGRDARRDDADEGGGKTGGPTVLGFAVECGPVALRGIDVVVRSAAEGGLCLTNRIETLELSGWRASAEVLARGRASVAGRVWEGLEIEGAALTCDMKLGLSRRTGINEAHGSLRADGVRGRSGAMRLEGLVVQTAIDLSPFWLRSAVTTVSRGEKTVGRLAANGAVDFNLKTCDLGVLLDEVTPELINLVSASKGLWMTSGTMRFNGQCQMLKNSRRIQGEADLREACFDRQPGPSALPPFAGRAAFAVEYLPEKQELAIERAQISLVEGQALLAAAGLDRPMRVVWGEGAEGTGSAELAVRVPENDLSRLSHFAEAMWGMKISAGMMSGSGRIVAARGGRELTWEGAFGARDLEGSWRGEGFSGLRVGVESNGRWRGPSGMEVTRARLAVEGAPEDSAVFEGSGSVTKEGRGMKASLTAGHKWMRRAASHHLGITSGRVGGEVEISERRDGRGTARWHVRAEGLSAQRGILNVTGAQFDTVGEIELGRELVTLRNARAAIWPGSDVAAGEASAQGVLWSAAGDASIEARLSGWRAENLKRVLVAPIAERLRAAEELQGLAVLKKWEGKWHFDGRTVLRKARFDAPGRTGKPGGASDVTLVVEAAQDGRRFVIREGTMTLEAAPPFENRLLLEGWVTPGFRRFDIAVRGRGFDAGPIAALADPAVWAVEAGGRESPGDADAAGPTTRRERAAPAEEPDRRLRLDIVRLALAGATTGSFLGEFSAGGGRWNVNSLKLETDGGRIEGHLRGGRNGGRWEAAATAQEFPASVLSSWAPEIAEALVGRVSGEMSCTGEGDAWLQSLGGAARLRWTGAQIEKLPPVRSFLKSAARRVSPELEQCRLAELSGSVAGADGSWRTEDLALTGDLAKVLFAGSIDWRGKLGGTVKFSGRTDLMQRAQVKVGDVVVGGATFVSFGRPEGDFTALPGALPVSGDVAGEIEADWEGWLKSAGLGGLAGFLDGMRGGRGADQERKKKQEDKR